MICPMCAMVILLERVSIDRLGGALALLGEMAMGGAIYSTVSS